MEHTRRSTATGATTSGLRADALQSSTSVSAGEIKSVTLDLSGDLIVDSEAEMKRLLAQQ